MAREKARLKDIAAKTGYGVNTVSLALRGSTRISAAAREIISKVAEELDYVPNHFAKSLVSLKSNTIGLILHDVTNPILTSAAQMIQLALAERATASSSRPRTAVSRKKSVPSRCSRREWSTAS